MEPDTRFRAPEIVADGVRFTLFAPRADAVDLCLFDGAHGVSESETVRMSADAEGLWTATAGGARSGQLYGFRVHGPWRPERGDRFNPAKLLVDPCALAISAEPSADLAFRSATDEDGPDPGDSAPQAPKSIVVASDFDWGNDAPPRRPWSESVLYECHVRGLTIRHPEVPEQHRGTYLGLAAEPVIAHLRALGVTAVELLPVQQIASEPHLLVHGRRNYFGYSPLGFRAPHAGYATAADGRQVGEFKQMVRALHEAGIEVILDLVFNHTAEGDHRGRSLLFRGVDNRLFYRLRKSDPSRYEDFTGCGNTLAAHRPEVAAYLVSTLRYWVEEMHVDGFRFDLATCLGRDPRAFDERAPFFRMLASQPWADRVKLIAEPWDLGPDGYQLGRFPSPWREWNDRFRDTARALWRGDVVTVSAVVAALDGSRARFGRRAQGPASIDFVTAHDGFTLTDLVSYESKHNWDNGEQNRDGHDHNLSRNWGVEGPTDQPGVLERRRRAKRNLLATLAVTRGVPMLLHGDELGRSQRGNNNAYCQDNEITWVDWNPDPGAAELLRFTTSLFRLRRRLLQPLATAGKAGTSDRWLDASGRRLAPATRDPGKIFALLVERPEHHGALVVFNTGTDDRLVRLPRLRHRGSWVLEASTAGPKRRAVTSAAYRIIARSVAILEFVPAELSQGAQMSGPGAVSGAVTRSVRISSAQRPTR